MTYFVLDHSLQFSGVWDDVVKRPYITAGFTAFVLMIPLALTSTQGWIRRLGGKRWNLLHRLVYVTAMGGVTALLLEGEARHHVSHLLRAMLSACCSARGCGSASLVWSLPGSSPSAARPEFGTSACSRVRRRCPARHA